jgi:hypothetical protein
MAWFCTKCGSENDDGETTCVVCGSGKVGLIETPENVVVNDQPPKAQEEAKAESMAQPAQKAPPQVSSPPPSHGVMEDSHEESSFVEIQFVQSPLDDIIGKKVKLNLSIFPSVSVGRSPENVLQIPDPSVSRMHGKITHEGKEFFFEDSGSANGTYIFDGAKFNEIKEKTKIEEKTLIKLGEGTIVKVTAVKSL